MARYYFPLSQINACIIMILEIPPSHVDAVCLGAARYFYTVCVLRLEYKGIQKKVNSGTPIGPYKAVWVSATNCLEREKG